MQQVGLPLLVKKIVDRAAAAAGLAILSPLLTGLAVLVRTTMGAPIFFKQQRSGLNGKPFTILKFRTMRDAVDGAGNMRDDEQRLTSLGRLMRRASLDELPELWNVLRGDMSLVGPRPLMAIYLERYSAHQRRRFEVLPGITGWAQIHGRNALDWDDKFELDVWYVDNWSLFLDAKILLKTIAEVASSRGTAHAGHATMPEFTGPRAKGAAGSGEGSG